MPAAWGILIALGLDESAAAALGAMLLAAAGSLAVLSQSLSRKLPWPFSVVAPVVAGLVSLTIYETVRWTQASAQGLASVIQAPWQAIWTVARSTVVATEQLAAALLAVTLVRLPQIVSWTQQLVGTAYTSAVAFAATQSTLVANYARQLVASAMQRADVQYVASVTHADQVGALVAQYARQLAGTLVQRMDAEAAQSLAYTNAAVGAATAYAQALTGEVLEFVQVGEATLRLGLEQVERTSTEYAEQVGRVAIDHADQAAAAAAAGAAAATAAVVARVGAIEDSPCFKACSPLGEIGGLLQALGDVGMAAILVDMAAELARDPAGAAHALDQVAGGAVRELVSDLGGLIGEGTGSLDVFTRVGGPALPR